jgi:CheY-like chemotaxis protein/anti-sigma regulatory factor (Ser/Thr protein kinase)
MKLIRATIPTTISITQQIDSDCGTINADPTQIHQIIMNLATNAFHAMEEQQEGELNVGLKEIELDTDDLNYPNMLPGPYVCLTVADNGMGMAKDIVDRIFDPFFTTKEKGKGTGMGLSVVHGIVKSMNGEIQVYSELVGGTEFRVYLPIVEDVSGEKGLDLKEDLPYGGERILLVDDEEAIINMGKQMLRRLGYSVSTRSSGIEALEAFRADPDRFDLVVTDMAMPKMAGTRLALELIKIRPNIPVLLCTGFSEGITDDMIESLGIKGLLNKPILKKDLARKIREVLDGK